MTRKLARRLCMAVVTTFLLATISGCIYLVYMPTKATCGSARIAHVSIDDVSHAFIDLATNADIYETIFQNEFFAHLKKLHDEYGLKVTLYSYEENDTFNIMRFPNSYRRDFSENSDWLKVGFHWISPQFSKSTPAISVTGSFRKFNSAMSRIAGDSTIATTIRLHYFFGGDSIITFINKLGGVNTILCADDQRLSYNLTPSQDKQLRSNGLLRKDGITYLPTNLRIENYKHPRAIARHLSKKDTAIVFTHEWMIENQRTKDIIYQAAKNQRFVPNYIQRYKFDRTVEWLHDNNYIFSL